jgi:hypothetical protein
METQVMQLPFRMGSFAVMADKLRNVTLRGQTKQPYKFSLMTIEEVDPFLLSPCQTYVLSSELKKLEQVRWKLLDGYGVDILSMHGYIEGGTDPVCDVLPPIVEESWRNGRMDMIIADGQHRAYLACKYGMKMKVVYIRGVDAEYYAYPLPGGWSEVNVIDQLTENHIKKYHVCQNYKQLFRDYTSQFNNLSVSRAVGKNP